MTNSLKALLLAATLGLGLTAAVPSTARADDGYWRNHWGWYDNTYRPYYQRSYYYGPTYAAPAPSYGNTYYGSSYYGAPYNGGYYYNQPYYGGGVQVGPLRFGWW